MSGPTARQGPLRVLLLGAPGSGKGTQGVRIAERYGAPHVSTGDLLRAQVKEGTELGRKAQSFMDAGDLVPDELILGMVLDSVFGAGSSTSYVLDGFPRTVAQATAAFERAVQNRLTLHAVICLDIDHEALVARLEQRGRETGRADDASEETVRHRIAEYEHKTLPLLDYYEGRGILVRLDATGPIDEVTERVFEALDAV